jgi:hypothetical protein
MFLSKVVTNLQYYCTDDHNFDMEGAGSSLFGTLQPKFDEVAARRQIPVAARSNAWVYGRSLVGIAPSNPAGGMCVCLL